MLESSRTWTRPTDPQGVPLIAGSGSSAHFATPRSPPRRAAMSPEAADARFGEHRGGVPIPALNGGIVMNSAAPLANTITLGVQDLQREVAFYRDLGWPLVFESEDFFAFELRGAVLTLFPVEKLAADAHARPAVGRGGIHSAVIISVDDPDAVDHLADRVSAAGGTITKAPTDAEFFEGRDAYFSDPEGNFWEIAYAPADNPVSAASRRAAGLE
jgi:catechol 2,3-dioxygenase-like lactoylglutathione lyase family enzyme